MINFFTRHFPPPTHGGGHQFFKSLIDNIDVPLTLYTHKEAFEPDNPLVKFSSLSFVPRSRRPSSGVKLYISLFWSLVYFHRVKYNLLKNGIHFGQIWPYGLVGLLLSKLSGVKYTIFILGEELSSIVYGNGIKKRIVKYFYKLIISNSSHVFAYSSFVKKNVEILFQKSKINKLSVFSLGIDLELFTKKNKSIHKNFLFSKDTITLFSISRHIERKGYLELLEGMKILENTTNNWHLYIGGEGPLTNIINQRINELGLSQKITMLGRLNERELHGCYLNSDIFLLSNLMLSNGDADGCPIVFLEAMSYGIPCIGGDVVGTHDAIINGETGFVVDSKSPEDISNKIEILINHPHKRAKMGKLSIDHIKNNYSWASRLTHFKRINDEISN